jgi:hypothetical protein
VPFLDPRYVSSGFRERTRSRGSRAAREGRSD